MLPKRILFELFSFLHNYMNIGFNGEFEEFHTCADPESFVRRGLTLNDFFLSGERIFFLRGERIQTNTAISGPSSTRQQNAI